MMQKIAYRKVLALTLPVVFGVNLILWILLPRSVLVPLWTIEGLLLDITGAFIALSPDLIGLRKHFEPTDKINRIETVRNQLFLNEELNEDDGYDGFNKLSQILGEDCDVKVPPDRITARSGGWGRAARVHFRYEKDNWSPDDYEGDEEYPSERYDSERIGPTGVMDSRVSHRLGEYRENGHQFGFVTGLSLLTIGFALQLCSVIFQDFIPIIQ